MYKSCSKYKYYTPFIRDPSRVSNGSLSPPFGENPSSPVAGEATQVVESKGGLSQSSGIHERPTEHFTQCQRLVGARVPNPFLSDEMEEERGSTIPSSIFRSIEVKKAHLKPQQLPRCHSPLRFPHPSILHQPQPLVHLRTNLHHLLMWCPDEVF